LLNPVPEIRPVSDAERDRIDVVGESRHVPIVDWLADLQSPKQCDRKDQNPADLLK
jgi:hypothetical protein